MASWGRPHAIKVALLASVILLILLNFYNFRFESSKLKFEAPTTISMSALHMSRLSQWPQRTHTGSEQRYFSKMLNTTSKINNSTSNNVPNNQLPPTFPADDLGNMTMISNNNNNNNNTNSIVSELPVSVTEIPDEPMPPIDVHGNHDNETYGSFKAHFELHQQRNLAAEQQSNGGSGTKKFFQKFMSTFGINMCPPTPPNLNGPLTVDTEFETLSSVEKKLESSLLPGGWFKPKECNPKDRVAIVIPYRDRPNHLPVFLKNIHPFLMKQQIEYGIFIVEQISDGLFNRAALMNVGFVEALKLNDWDCFIFHDIDLIPMDDRNLYTCPDQPRHMSVAVDTMGFKLPYSTIFGGVSAMTVKQFLTVNGFSNAFWGWGGEDDDMSNRLKHVGYHIARYPVNIARYTMLSHRKEKANPKRYEKLVTGAKKFDTEGLNSLKYKVHLLEKKPLYTWILVEIKQESGS